MKQPPLHQMIMTQAVRLSENAAPLEDGAAMRNAAQAASTPAGRIMARAAELGERLKYTATLERLARVLPLAWGLVLLLVLLIGMSITAGTVSERRINLMTAVFGMLGMHLLTWFLWLYGLLRELARRPPAFSYSFGHAMLALAERFVRRRSASILVQAALDVLRQSHLSFSAFGLISHFLWSCAFVVALLVLAFSFSFRSYEMGWETTILPSRFFAAFVSATSALPHWLGFPLPDLAAQSAPGNAMHASDWAWWLIGVLAVYGLGIRLLSLFVCWGLWRHGQHRLAPDLEQHYFQRLADRFAAMDAANGEARMSAQGKSVRETSPMPALVWFEFSPEQALPELVPAKDSATYRIAGTLEDRRAVLDALQCVRHARLLIAVDAFAVPDRGTQRFLREALSFAGQGAVLLASEGERDPGCDARWRVMLDETPCYTDPAEAAAWLGGANG